MYLTLEPTNKITLIDMFTHPLPTAVADQQPYLEAASGGHWCGDGSGGARLGILWGNGEGLWDKMGLEEGAAVRCLQLSRL